MGLDFNTLSPAELLAAESAVLTICTVRSERPVEKYDITRLRRLLAFPT